MEGAEVAEESRAQRSLRSRGNRARGGVEGAEIAEESRAQRSLRGGGRRGR